MDRELGSGFMNNCIYVWISFARMSMYSTYIEGQTNLPSLEDVHGLRGVSSVPFPFWFPFQLHCELVSSGTSSQSLQNILI